MSAHKATTEGISQPATGGGAGYEVEAEEYVVRDYESFDDMGLPDNLLRGIYAYGFNHPSQIQAKAIVPMMEGREVLGQQQSGTGKTGAFVIGSLAQIDVSLVAPQVLILSHSRELAMQTATCAKAISSYMGIKVLYVGGGTRIDHDVRDLDKGVHFIVGTPGRIKHLINLKKLNTATIKRIIIDEADQMLKDRFKDQVGEIIEPEEGCPFSKDLKIALFSATLPEEALEVAEQLMPHHVKIIIPKEEVSLKGIKQYYFLVEDRFKFDALLEIYSHLKINQLIIFVNSQDSAEKLAHNMERNGHRLRYIHSGLPQEERMQRMKEFRAGDCKVLISTDLLARGIDVQQISLVINYEMPHDNEHYIHRIGRSGRYGRKGCAINLVNNLELSRNVEDIKAYYQTEINPLEPSDIEQITGKSL